MHLFRKIIMWCVPNFAGRDLKGASEPPPPPSHMKLKIAQYS